MVKMSHCLCVRNGFDSHMDGIFSLSIFGYYNWFVPSRDRFESCREIILKISQVVRQHTVNVPIIGSNPFLRANKQIFKIMILITTLIALVFLFLIIQYSILIAAIGNNSISLTVYRRYVKPLLGLYYMYKDMVNNLPK